MIQPHTITTDKQVLAVVPARYASQRFPGKPLVSIVGLPMVVRAYQQAKAAVELFNGQAVVATDDQRIADVVNQHKGEVCLTQANHPTGTDRLWEVAETYPDAEIIVNVQGDEPFIPPVIIQQAVHGLLNYPDWDMATLITPIKHDVDIYRDNPNVVKAIVTPYSSATGGDNTYRALYFTRAAAPYPRNQPVLPLFRHLGLYVYRRAALKAFVGYPPSPLEQTESLEQLRALENGLTIGAVSVDEAPLGVDTPEDVAAVEQWYRNSQQ